MNFLINHYKKIFFFILLLILVLGIYSYQGSVLIYIFFSIVSFFLLFYSIEDNFNFFEFFFSFFLFLGFWFNFSFKIILAKIFGINKIFQSKFGDAGQFDHLPDSYDSVLLISIYVFFGVILAIFLRKIFFFKRNYKENKYNFTIKFIFLKYKKIFFFLILFFIILFSFLNFFFQIYQRGSGVNTSSSFLRFFFVWVMSFGLCSVCAIFLDLELKLDNKKFGRFLFLSLFENCITNLSILSRGLVFNGFSNALGFYKSLQVSIFEKRKFLFKFFLFLLILFLISYLVVDYLRIKYFYVLPSTGMVSVHSGLFSDNFGFISNALSAVIARLYYIEGLMAVYSLNNLSFELLRQAFLTDDIGNILQHKSTFFDILKNDFRVNNSQQTSISLPGIVGFLFYSGSIPFLVFVIFIITFLFSCVEIFFLKFLDNNALLCSLFSITIAYRLWHFGFNPSASWKILVAIFFNIVLIKLTFIFFNNINIKE